MICSSVDLLFAMSAVLLIEEPTRNPTCAGASKCGTSDVDATPDPDSSGQTSLPAHARRINARAPLSDRSR
jgi:hypothetical protein